MADTTLSGFNLQAFQSKLGNVAATNQFAANITLPQAIQGLFPELAAFQNKCMYMIQSASRPTMSIGEISLPFRSGKFRIPGDREYTQTWPVKLRMDVDGVAQRAMERWSDLIVGQVDQDAADVDDDVLEYMGTGDLYQLSRNSRILRQWQLPMIWPSEVGDVTFDWDQENTVCELEVTFVIQHIESDTIRNSDVALFSST